MIGIIIVSHGNYATEIINLVELIYGRVNNLKAITLGLDESLEDFSDKLNFEIENFGFKEVLVLVDFLGGTPYNSTQKLIGKSNVEIITGVNIPMVLEILPLLNGDLSEVSLVAEAAGRKGIMNISKLIKERFEGESLNEDSI